MFPHLVCITIFFICWSNTACGAERAEQESSGNQVVDYFDEDDLKYFPLSRYEQYPEPVKLLIRQADIENGECRGRFDKNTLRACNRRELIMIELEKRGWCHGGSLVGYEMHWLKCANDPYYIPRDPSLNNLYSEEEIEEAVRLQNR